MFVHYHGIIYSSRDKNFDNNYDNSGAPYYESVNSSFMLYKFYLEVLCRVIFNNVLKKVLPIVLSDFDTNTFSAWKKRSFCRRNFCTGTERKKIISIVIKETAYFSLHILKLNNDCINVDFVSQIFNGYKKGEDYTSQKLDKENKIQR